MGATHPQEVTDTRRGTPKKDGVVSILSRSCAQTANALPFQSAGGVNIVKAAKSTGVKIAKAFPG
jgi:hypothetical protein